MKFGMWMVMGKTKVSNYKALKPLLKEVY